MFSLYRQAQAWGSKPSDIVGITDLYVAYCFNEAVYLWGVYVESELHEAGHSAKTKKQSEMKIKARMNMLLNPPEKPEEEKTLKYVEQKAIPARSTPSGQFRDPATIFRK